MKTRVLLLLSTACFFILSCTKENTSTPATTVSPDSLLVGKKWIIQKLTYVQNNKLYSYVRGGSANTADFSADVISFKKDSTGSYSNGIYTFNLTWQFSDAAKTIIKYTIANYDKGIPKTGTNLNTTWENVVLSASSLKYAEIYTNSDGNSVISSGFRIPQ